MNRASTSPKAPPRHIYHRRSLVAFSYIASLVLWYRRSSVLSSLKYERDDDAISFTGRLITSDTLRYDNRISLSLQKKAASTADSYYTRFSEPTIYFCGDEQGKQDLPSTLHKYFNFIASIRTDLKIILIGDSISSQFAQAFEATALDVGQEGRVRAKKVMANRVSTHVCMSISSPIRGGGVSAFWRVTNLLLKETNRWPAKLCKWEVRNSWNEGMALAFLNHEYNSTQLNLLNATEYSQSSPAITEFWQQKKLASFKTGNVVNSFDAAILRLPHGWLNFNDMNIATITETIETTHRIVGAKTIVIPTVPFSNNVKSESDWKRVAQINRLIREIARNITESESDIEYVLVQEFGNLTNQVLTENAKNLDLISPKRDIDYSQEGWEVDLANIFLQRPSNTAKKWPPSDVQVCSSLPSNESQTCPGVKISPDGMHWCVETFGVRFTASIACLLGCVYNVARPPTNERVRKCEQRCNDQFMSLAVLGDNMFQNDVGMS